MKCGYCGRESSTGWGRFCSEECRLKEKEFIERAERQAKPFLIMVFAPLLLIIVGLIFIEHVFLFMALPMFIIGMVMIICPFTTPETVELVGLRKSISVARGCGLVLIFMGAVFLICYISMLGLIV